MPVALGVSVRDEPDSDLKNCRTSPTAKIRNKSGSIIGPLFALHQRTLADNREKGRQWAFEYWCWLQDFNPPSPDYKSGLEINKIKDLSKILLRNSFYKVPRKAFVGLARRFIAERNLNGTCF